MKKIFLILPFIVLMSCKQDMTPKLVVLISIDHLSYKAFEHYSDLYTGGFKWLREHGVQFSNTYHEHGYTATGPGHFVLGSGRYPGLAGVLGNSWYDRKTEKNRYCVEDNDAKSIGIPSDGRSYRLIDATTTGDWLKAIHPESKVYSMAGKDRASIFMGGKNADMSLWYNWNGAFTTTDYYTNTIPEWLTDFNNNLHLMSYRDSMWTRSLSEENYLRYARIDHFVGESDNYLSDEYSPVFPIGFDSTITDSMILDYIGGFPWQERNTLELAETVIREEKLGKDNIPDLISIGLSATDWITHDYGPRSQEGMDNLIKMDQYLGHFLDVVEQEVGLNNTIIVLTADHGGLELPEFIKVTTGEYTGRIDGTLRDEAIEKAFSNIDSLVGDHDFIVRYGLGFYFDKSKILEQNINVDEIVKIIKSELEKVEGIALVLTKDEILNASPDDTLLTRMKHFTHPELSPDLWTIQEKNWLYRNPYGTSHGTPYDYDAHVPFVISHPTFKSKTISDQISTVDIAPTIADILGVIPDKRVDGHSRKSVLP